jgi:F420-non-reducing hydrogenase small subunit
VSKVDIVLWPVALDFKYKDVQVMEDKSIAVSFINGAVRTSEQEHIAKLLRKKSGLVVAFGACSSLGGIPALANLTSKKEIFDRSYHCSPTISSAKGPEPKQQSTYEGSARSLPEFFNTVYKLSDVIDVDYYLPGCPPTPNIIGNAIDAILAGNLPAKGAILSPDKSLCSSCDRNKTKPEDMAIKKIKRVIDLKLDPEKCFLAQGVICMGPATRDGCDFPCVKGNMPCTGCFGPTDGCKDTGAKMIAALGGILEGVTKEEMSESMKGMVDSAGTFYRYSLSASIIGSERKEAP